LREVYKLRDELLSLSAQLQNFDPGPGATQLLVGRNNFLEGTIHSSGGLRTSTSFNFHSPASSTDVNL
jgi:hypothetical protein